MQSKASLKSQNILSNFPPGIFLYCTASYIVEQIGLNTRYFWSMTLYKNFILNTQTKATQNRKYSKEFKIEMKNHFLIGLTKTWVYSVRIPWS